jgi:hypothetical protein
VQCSKKLLKIRIGEKSGICYDDERVGNYFGQQSRDVAKHGKTESMSQGRRR